MIPLPRCRRGKEGTCQPINRNNSDLIELVIKRGRGGKREGIRSPLRHQQEKDIWQLETSQNEALPGSEEPSRCFWWEEVPSGGTEGPNRRRLWHDSRIIILKPSDQGQQR